MPVYFKPTLKWNPQNRKEAPKYFATIVRNRTVTLDDLAKSLADESSLTRGDVHAVIIGLVGQMKRELSDGNNVILGDLGSFMLNASSHGKETPEALRSTDIKKIKIQFRQSSELTTMLKRVKTKKIKAKKEKHQDK